MSCVNNSFNYFFLLEGYGYYRLGSIHSIFSPPMYFSFSLRLFRLKLLRIAYVKDLL